MRPSCHWKQLKQLWGWRDEGQYSTFLSKAFSGLNYNFKQLQSQVSLKLVQLDFCSHNRKPGNYSRQILTATPSRRPHLLFDRSSCCSQHIYSLLRPHRHGNFLLPTSIDGFLRTTMKSQWITVVWDKMEMEGKNRDTWNPAVANEVEGGGKSHLEYFS